MLGRAHRAGIVIEIGIYLYRRTAIAVLLQYLAHRSRSNTFTHTTHHSACNYDVFGAFIDLRQLLAPWILRIFALCSKRSGDRDPVAARLVDYSWNPKITIL